jgi:hypothetical protein
MILKVWNPSTSRWRMLESSEVEVGTGWLGSFGAKGDVNWRFALYDTEVDCVVKSADEPVARRAPLLIAGEDNDMFVDETVCGQIIDTNGEARVNVKMAVIVRTENAGGDKIIVFNTPAYLMNDAGRTIERL